MTTYRFGNVVLMPPDGSRLEVLCEELRREFPNLVMQRKRDHWYWKLLHVLLCVVTFGANRKFLSSFTTTGRDLVAWSDSQWDRIQVAAPGWDDRIWSCLMHEREHLRQFRRYGVFLFVLLYIMVFLPVGLAYFRARFERAGYIQTLRCWWALNRTWARSSEAKKWWVGQFTGANYGWAWPFKGQVTAWYDRELYRLEATV